MPIFFRHILRALIHLGYLGPLALGAADSSFLFLPIGNDLLVVILVARHHSDFWIYAFTAAIGSALGVFFLDLVARRAGASGVQKIAGPGRFAYLTRKVNQQGGLFVALACLAPPPFPFTMLMASASAFGYSRKKLLAVVFCARLLRFFILSMLAIQYGRGILRVVNTDAFKYSALSLSVLCLLVSVFSIAKWVRTGRDRPNSAPQAEASAT